MMGAENNHDDGIIIIIQSLRSPSALPFTVASLPGMRFGSSLLVCFWLGSAGAAWFCPLRPPSRVVVVTGAGTWSSRVSRPAAKSEQRAGNHVQRWAGWTTARRHRPKERTSACSPHPIFGSVAIRCSLRRGLSAVPLRRSVVEVASDRV